jgi:hypothetical protein
MQFEWILPVIIFAVWVLQQVLRNREVDEPVRPKPGGPAPNRNPTNDIDRFLQEIDRLRRKPPEERGEPVEKPVPRPVPRARPVPPVVPRARPVPRPSARPSESVPAVVVIDAPQAQPSVVTSLPPLPALPPTDPRAPQVDRRGDRNLPPIIATTLNLLRSPQTLAAAFVLQEVLDPPKCKRR